METNNGKEKLFKFMEENKIDKDKEQKEFLEYALKKINQNKQSLNRGE